MTIRFLTTNGPLLISKYFFHRLHRFLHQFFHWFPAHLPTDHDSDDDDDDDRWLWCPVQCVQYTPYIKALPSINILIYRRRSFTMMITQCVIMPMPQHCDRKHKTWLPVSRRVYMLYTIFYTILYYILYNIRHSILQIMLDIYYI